MKLFCLLIATACATQPMLYNHYVQALSAIPNRSKNANFLIVINPNAPKPLTQLLAILFSTTVTAPSQLIVCDIYSVSDFQAVSVWIDMQNNSGIEPLRNILAKQRYVSSIEAINQYKATGSESIGVQVGAPWNLVRLSQRFLPLNFNPLRYLYLAGVGADVDIYVVDSGIDIAHPEFEGRARFGASFVDGQSGDGFGHGTHVAGIISSKTFGVCKGAHLIAVKVLDDNGNGSTVSVLGGLSWISRSIRNGRKSIVNLSLSGPRSPAMNQAIDSLSALNVAIVTAAGNGNQNACTVSPSSATTALTVAASTNADTRLLQPASNYGPCVKIIAPGSFVTSAWPGGGSASMSGTSMAAPHMSGAIAEFWSGKNIAVTKIILAIQEFATQDILASFPEATPNLLLYTGPR